jgi:hypothetical protein
MPASAKRRTCALTEAAYRLRSYNVGHRLSARRAANFLADPAGRAPQASVATGRLKRQSFGSRTHAALAFKSIHKSATLCGTILQITPPSIARAWSLEKSWLLIRRIYQRQTALVFSTAESRRAVYPTSPSQRAIRVKSSCGPTALPMWHS